MAGYPRLAINALLWSHLRHFAFMKTPNSIWLEYTATLIQFVFNLPP